MAARCLKDGAPGTGQPPLQACSPSLLSAPQPVSVREAQPGFRSLARPEAPQGFPPQPSTALPLVSSGSSAPAGGGSRLEALLTAQGRLRPGAQDFKEWVEEHPRWEGVERHGVYSGPLLSTEPGGKASQESGQRRWEPGDGRSA